MSERGSGALYTPDILALAIEVASYPLIRDLVRQGEAASRVCGSRIAIGADLDGRDEISAIGAQISACAVGQAAAAIFLGAAVGCSQSQIETAHDAIEAWLRERGDMPNWSRLESLMPARGYPARHAAILLPWKAAIAALSNPPRRA